MPSKGSTERRRRAQLLRGNSKQLLARPRAATTRLLTSGTLSQGLHTISGIWHTRKAGTSTGDHSVSRLWVTQRDASEDRGVRSQETPVSPTGRRWLRLRVTHVTNTPAALHVSMVAGDRYNRYTPHSAHVSLPVAVQARHAHALSTYV